MDWGPGEEQEEQGAVLMGMVEGAGDSALLEERMGVIMLSVAASTAHWLCFLSLVVQVEGADPRRQMQVQTVVAPS
jgi:hypothetical protein